MMSAALVWGYLLPVQAQHRLSVSVAPTFSTSNFQWSIAGNNAGTNPNVYSELRWNNIQRAGLGITASWHFMKRFDVSIQLAENYTIAGEATDTDYKEDNRHNIAYHGTFNSNKGNHTLLAVSAGYTLPLGGNSSLTFYPGYTFSRETLYLLPADAFAPADLRSTYTVTWKGIMTGISLKKYITSNLFVKPGIRYYQLKYLATANWNLIPQFNHPLSFAHNANGYTLEPSLQLGYRALYVSCAYTYRTTGRGVEKLYLNTGAIKETQFNGAEQKILQLSIGFTARFLQRKGH
ncbi:hypothetical protein [Chitinophaga sp. MM2321]|uniref:hypothetical protein n=1 Tax=Chitinophaga sp. MM2321 TaxID=3137178 RepID=UPI0032D5ABE2